MKNLIAASFLILATAVTAAPLQFSDAELDIVLLSDPPATRNGVVVTFAAESTFKTAAGTEFPPGTKMTLIWSVNCARKMQRIVLASIRVPGKVAFNATREEMVETAKREPFIIPKDTVSKQVIESVCR